MEKKRVLIIFGGCSMEYGISLQSAYSVITNMNTEKYDTLLIGITKDGSWFRYYGDISKILSNTWYLDKDNCVPALISPDRDKHKIIELKNGKVEETEFDIAYPILHGKNGEDGTIQGLIELAGIPLVGCDTISSALCMDKDRAHKIVQQAGVRCPLAVVFTQQYGEEELIEKTAHLSYPLFVKPIKAGSSYGISKIDEQSQLVEAVGNAFLYDNQVIIEENIDGFEVGCAVLGNDELTIGDVDEIELTNGFFDYDEKYNRKSAKIHMPARIDNETASTIKEAASIIYHALGCRGFARVDMFLTRDNEIVFNEVNTIPGFTSKSRYPSMMKGIGLEYEDIIDRLIQLGFEK